MSVLYVYYYTQKRYSRQTITIPSDKSSLLLETILPISEDLRYRFYTITNKIPISFVELAMITEDNVIDADSFPGTLADLIPSLKPLPWKSGTIIDQLRLVFAEPRSVYVLILIEKSLIISKSPNPRTDVFLSLPSQSATKVREEHFPTVLKNIGFDLDSTDIPPTLLYEPFAHFLDKVASFQHDVLDSNLLAETLSLMRYASNYYDEEPNYRPHVHKCIENLLTGCSVSVSSERQKVDVMVTSTDLRHRLALIELKRRSSDGEPLGQVMCYLREGWRLQLEGVLRSCCPVVLITIRGPIMSFYFRT
ncbi:hypothetical protein RCL1_002196 [Eukaryota sp. TZLM3-RCL]